MTFNKGQPLMKGRQIVLRSNINVDLEKSVFLGVNDNEEPIFALEDNQGQDHDQGQFVHLLKAIFVMEDQENMLPLVR